MEKSYRLYTLPIQLSFSSFTKHPPISLLDMDSYLAKRKALTLYLKGLAGALGALTLVALPGAWAETREVDEVKSNIQHPEFVGEEIQREQEKLQAKLIENRKRIAELDSRRSQVIARSEAHSQVLLQGEELFRKYGNLLSVRYVNDRGRYQSGMEISQKDVAHVNRLFETYLQATPLQEKASAGYARRLLEWGAQRLNKLAKVHAAPTEKNNSELQLIAKQKRDARLSIENITALAQRLKVPLNPDADTATASAPAPAARRVPAAAAPATQDPEPVYEY